MNGSKAVYTVLKNDATILTLVSFKGASPCISVGPREPTTWSVSDVTLSIYNATPTSATEEYLQAEWTVNCRAGSRTKSEALAQAVVDALNRKPINVTEGRFYCIYGFLLQPEDEMDSYNLPVTVTVKGIKNLD